MTPLIYILEERCSGLTCRHERTIWRQHITKGSLPTFIFWWAGLAEQMWKSIQCNWIKSLVISIHQKRTIKLFHLLIYGADKSRVTVVIHINNTVNNNARIKLSHSHNYKSTLGYPCKHSAEVGFLYIRPKTAWDFEQCCKGNG